MTDWLLNHGVALQEIVAGTLLLIVLWIWYGRRTRAPSLVELGAMSLHWLRDRRLHRKDPH